MWGLKKDCKNLEFRVSNEKKKIRKYNKKKLGHSW